EKNPLLERAGDGEPGGAGDSDIASDANTDGRADDAVPYEAYNGIDDRVETSRAAIEERLGTGLETEFPDEAGPGGAPAGSRDFDGASDWPGAGSGIWADAGAGGREGSGDLEAYVPAPATLADHLAAQLALALADPKRRIIGRH